MKKFLFIFLGIVINHCVFAQAVTKNGQITTTGSIYVSSNGAIGATNGVNNNGKIVLAAIPHALGDTYQGGIIFYLLQSGDPGYSASVQHGLIAAPTDQSTSTTWGCTTEIGSGAQGQALGTGATNTAAIISGYTTSGCTTSAIAAQLCKNLTTGGYTDWYLPSILELTQLYTNQSYVGNLSNSSAYWSSSEYVDTHPSDSADDAYYFVFPSGSPSVTYKLGTAYVRAIRSF